MKVRNQALNATNVLEDLKLSGSGNLRVCLQELGNEGSERLNVDVGSTVSQLPTALTGEGNLKVSIQEDHTHDLATASNQTLTNSKLDTIATNTSNIKISTDSVNLNVDTLETLQTATNTKLDTLETSNQAIKTAVELLDNAVSGSEFQVDIVSSALPSGGATEAKQDVIEASLTSIESKMDVDNAVYDNQLTKLTEIDTAIDTIDTVLDNSLTKQGEIETSLNSLISANHTDLVALEASLTSIEGKIDTLDSVLDNVLTKQSDGLQQVKIKGVFNNSLPTVSDGNFEFLQCDTNGRIEVRTHSDDVGVATVVNTPESTAIPITGVLVHDDSNNAVRSLKCDTSGNLLVSASLSSTDNAVLDSILAKNTEIETSANALISANHTDLVALEASLTSIEGKIDTLDSVQDNALTSLQLIDDIVKAEDSAHSSLLMVLV